LTTPEAGYDTCKPNGCDFAMLHECFSCSSGYQKNDGICWYKGCEEGYYGDYALD